MKLLSHLLIGGAAVVIGNGGGAEAQHGNAMHEFFNFEESHAERVHKIVGLRKQLSPREAAARLIEAQSPTGETKYLEGPRFVEINTGLEKLPTVPFHAGTSEVGKVYCYDTEHVSSVAMLRRTDSEGMKFYEYQMTKLLFWGFLKDLLRSKYSEDKACVVLAPMESESHDWEFDAKATKGTTSRLNSNFQVRPGAEAFSIPGGPTDSGKAQGIALRGLTDVGKYLMMDVGYQAGSLWKITEGAGAREVRLEGAEADTRLEVRNGVYEVIRVVAYETEHFERCVLILAKPTTLQEAEDTKLGESSTGSVADPLTVHPDGDASSSSSESSPTDPLATTATPEPVVAEESSPGAQPSLKGTAVQDFVEEFIPVEALPKKSKTYTFERKGAPEVVALVDRSLGQLLLEAKAERDLQIQRIEVASGGDTDINNLLNATRGKVSDFIMLEMGKVVNAKRSVKWWSLSSKWHSRSKITLTSLKGPDAIEGLQTLYHQNRNLVMRLDPLFFTGPSVAEDDVDAEYIWLFKKVKVDSATSEWAKYRSERENDPEVKSGCWSCRGKNRRPVKKSTAPKEGRVIALRTPSVVETLFRVMWDNKEFVGRSISKSYVKTIDPQNRSIMLTGLSAVHAASNILYSTTIMTKKLNNLIFVRAEKSDVKKGFLNNEMVPGCILQAYRPVINYNDKGFSFEKTGGTTKKTVSCATVVSDKCVEGCHFFSTGKLRKFKGISDAAVVPFSATAWQ